MDNDRSATSDSQIVILPPFRAIQRCANLGCELCIILTASADIHYLPEECLYTSTVSLKRMETIPGKFMQLYVDGDNVSSTHFFYFPTEWSKNSLATSHWLCLIWSLEHLCKASLNRPSREVDLMQSWLRNCLESHLNCAAKDPSFVLRGC